jgi:recombination protein RecT
VAKPTKQEAQQTLKQQAQSAVAVQHFENKELTVKDKAKTIEGLLEKLKPNIKKSLLRSVPIDYIVSTAMTALRTNPALLDCTPASLLAGVLQSVQLNLRLDGPLGHAYLVPFRNNKRGTVEAQFIPGYRGLMDLAYRSERIKDVAAGVVYDGDTFEWERGSNNHLKHVEADTPRDISKATHAYAYSHMQNGGFLFVVLTRQQIEKRRALSKARDAGPWVEHAAKMWAKTAVRDLASFIPMSIEMARAVALDQMAEAGLPQELELTEHGILPAAFPASPEPVQVAPGMPIPVQEAQASETPEKTQTILEVIVARIGEAKDLSKVDWIAENADVLHKNGKITDGELKEIILVLERKRGELTPKEELFPDAGPKGA